MTETETPVKPNKKMAFYLELARLVSKQATCPRAQVGAIIVTQDRVVSLGYNGSPRGTPHCDQDGCWMASIKTPDNPDGRFSCQRAVHAEMNAVVNAAHSGASTNGGTMYATHRPCINCLKAIINSGIVQVYYLEDYTDVMAENLEALIKIPITKVEL